MQLGKNDTEIHPVDRRRGDGDVVGVRAEVGPLGGGLQHRYPREAHPQPGSEAETRLDRGDLHPRRDQPFGRLPCTRAEVERPSAWGENAQLVDARPQGIRVGRAPALVGVGVMIEVLPICHTPIFDPVPMIGWGRAPNTASHRARQSGRMGLVKVLSIQSAVAYGHVGNSAAVFPLQRIGVEVMPVYTVNFSNHTGYGAWRGPLIAPEDVRDVILGIEERGVLGQIDVVLSGYQGGVGIGDVIIDAVKRVKAANPSAIYACDPVMGNAKSGCFVAPEIPVLLRDRVVPVADIITPNQFELGYLTDTEPSTLESTLDSVDLARAMGPSIVLVTSVERPDRDPATVEMLAVDDTGGWIVRTPYLPFKANGSGDVTAALFTAHYRETGDLAVALERTSSSVYDLIETTHRSGERELRLVQAQEFYAHPRMQFTAERVR
jgi:pyridoxine kinase